MTSSAPSSNSRNARRKILFVLPFVCSVILAVVAFQLFGARGSAHRVLVENLDGTHSNLDISALKGKQLLNWATGQREALNFKAENTLLIFMSPGDCPNCLDERAVWENLVGTYDSSRLQVVGILLRTSRDESRAFTKAYKLPFAVYLDDEHQLEQSTELPRSTPFKVLVNRDGAVLLANGPNPHKDAQKQFGQDIAARLGAAHDGR